MDSIKLSSTSYSNVKFDNDATKNDSVNSALLADLQNAAQAAGVVVTITTAKSGHNKTTKSGAISRHYVGAAVDIAIIDGIGSDSATNANNGNPQFREKGNKLANALRQLGYTCCSSESGNNKAVLWQTNTGGNHFNHLHVSNKSGVPSNVKIIDLEDNPEEESKPNTDSSSTSSIDVWGMFADALTNTNKVAEDINRFEEIISYNNRNISEDIDFKKMIRGSQSHKLGNKTILKSFSNDYVFSPVDGIVKSINNSVCNGLILIKKSTEDDEFIEICGVTPVVRVGQQIYAGDKLGISKSKKVDVENKKNIKSSPEKKIKSYGKKSYEPFFTKKSLSDLPYKLQALPITLPLDIAKSILGIKEDINNIKKLLK